MAAPVTYGERFMDFPCVDVAQLEASFFQNLWYAVGRSQQQFVNGILRNVQEIANVRLGLETELLGLCLAHDQTRRSTVGLKSQI